MKFENSANQVLSLDFARIKRRHVEIGASHLTRRGFDELFSHLIHATIAFMSQRDVRCVLAIGNDEKLHGFYRQAFLGNALRHLGVHVDELDLREVDCLYESVLALRRL